MRLQFFQKFKFLYKDIEHWDSTSRMLSSLRPFLLISTAVAYFVLFEELSQKGLKDESAWHSQFYKRQKKIFVSFKLRFLDIIEIENPNL